MGNGQLIYSVDGKIIDPLPGFYAIKFRARTRERALGIKRQENGNWLIYIDGRALTDASPDWKKAFGSIFGRCQPLAGRKISKDEYAHIIRERTMDVFKGIDLEKPMDINLEKVAI